VQLKNIGIITSDIDRAKVVFRQLYNKYHMNIKNYRITKEDIVLLLTDDTRYTWVRPILSSKGHRFDKAYIDNTIPEEILYNIIYPMCYKENNNIIDFNSYIFQVTQI
jgi:hypothetical protein